MVGRIAESSGESPHVDHSRPTSASVRSAVAAERFCKSAAWPWAACRCRRLLRAEAQAGISSSHKSVIMIFLSGGPPHQDMVDLKPDAPGRDSRRVQADPHQRARHRHLRAPAAPGGDDGPAGRSSARSSAARGITAAFQCMTGRHAARQPQRRLAVARHRPCRKLQGPAHRGGAAVRRPVAEDEDAAPGPIVGRAGLPRPCARRRSSPTPTAWAAWSSRACQPRTARRSPGAADRASTACAASWTPAAAWTGPIEFTRQALSILTSSRLAEALDLEREPATRCATATAAAIAEAGRLRRRRPAAERLLPDRPPAGRGRRARRDAGLRPLGLARQAARHDLRERPPPSARCSTAACAPCVEDLHDRGLDKDVSVVVWGEFGRTPKINKDAGRDHWPR